MTNKANVKLGRDGRKLYRVGHPNGGEVWVTVPDDEREEIMPKTNPQERVDFEALMKERVSLYKEVTAATDILRSAQGLWIVASQQDKLVDAIQEDTGKRERLREAVAMAEEARTRFLEAAEVVNRELLGDRKGGSR